METEFTFDEPLAAAMNENGEIAVLDSLGSRIVFISGDYTVINIVSYNGLFSVTPSSGTAVSMDNSYIYILDHTLSANGTSVNGDRVLVYNTNGKYEKILISSDELSGDDYQYRIRNIYTNGGKVFATLYDEFDNETALVGEITDGSLSVVHEFSSNGNAVYDIFYMPESDVSIVVSYSGNYDFYRGDKKADIIFDEECGFFDDVCILPDGRTVALDVNANTLSKFDADGREELLIETSARDFSYCGTKLISADPDTYAIYIYDMSNGQQKQIESLPYSYSIIFYGYLAWAAAIVGSIAFIILAVMIIKYLIKVRMNEIVESAENGNSRKSSDLYGKSLLTMIFIFAVTSLIFASFYYDFAIEKSRNTVVCAAYGLRETSESSFGAALDNIHSQYDYGSDDYNRVIDFTSSICMTGVEAPQSINLSCEVIKFIDGSDNIMIVSDPSNQMRLGTIMTPDELSANQMLEPVERALTGIMAEHIVTYNNNTVLYEVYSPVYNSDGEITGLVVPILNETVIASNINNVILEKGLEIFTLLAGLTFLMVEARTGWKVSGIQRRRRLRGTDNTTVLEGRRTIGILIRLPSSVFSIFSTLIASEIIAESGMENPILLAMPLTAYSICTSLTISLISTYAKRNPRRFFTAGIVLQGMASLIVIASVLTGSIYLLVAGAFVFGVGYGCCYSTFHVLSLLDLNPDPSMNLYAGVASPISVGIGVSIGSVIRGAYGDVALMLFVLLFCVLGVIVVRYLVGTDISSPSAESTDAAGSASRKHAMPGIVSYMKKNLRFFRRPKVFAVIISGLFLFGIITNLEAAVLPLLNSMQGLPDALIGAVTFFVEFLIIYIEPRLYALSVKSKLPEISWVAIGTGIIALLFAIFGLQGSMKTFMPILVAVGVFDGLYSEMIDGFTVREAALSGVSANDVSIGLDICYSLGTYVAPVILTLMITSGLRNFAYIWMTVCAVCAILILIVTHSKNALET